MKRKLAVTLCAALVAGLLPEPALAQAVRIVTPAPAAGIRVAPAVLPASAPGLSGSLGPALSLPTGPTLTAPRLAAPTASAVSPAAAASGITLSVQMPVAAAQAAQAAAVNATLSATPLPISLPQAGEGRVRADALGQAQGFAAETTAAPLSRLDAGAASVAAGRLFDSSPRTGAANAVKMPGVLTDSFSAGSRIVKRAIARAPIGRLLPAATAERWGRSPPLSKVDTPFTRDAWGGPKALPGFGGTSRVGRVLARAGRDLAYGAKWALTLFGISSALSVVTAPLASLPWGSWVPHGMLGMFGRVELLTDFGPAAIAEMVGAAPLLFFGLALPQAVLMEEISYRLLSFGITFGLLAAVRPAANSLSAFLDKVPDLFGMRSAAQWVLRQAAKVSGKAFTIAAVMSSLSFAAAHFAAWGVNPATMAVHTALGLGLAWVAYRSRGLTAPFMAHLGYNALSIGVGVLVPALLLSQMASLTAVILGIFGATFAWYQYRSWTADARAAEDAARGVTRPARAGWVSGLRWTAALLLPALLITSFATFTPRRDPVQIAPPHRPEPNRPRRAPGGPRA